MEPLRRPNTVTAEESRRVPPLRIRIPQRREPRQRRPARVHDYSPPLPKQKEKDPDDIVTNVVTKLVEQVCTAHPLSVNLIMEPLRRPNTVTAEESRRVPPLRIRIPQRREPRQRRPARVHDYSPPLPVSRIHRFEETLKNEQ
ncbi:hypothetical protein WUBG_19132, partial [Wuchereria bancrofti]